jgi:excisionase family DNA binding protein
MQEFLLTTEQVAEYLKIDKLTLYRLVTGGKIAAFKVGNQWRFKPTLLDEWLLKNSNIPSSSRKSQSRRSSAYPGLSRRSSGSTRKKS